MTISEVITVITVGLTAIGALYALRRQGDSLVVADNSELRQKVRTLEEKGAALESNNRYLLNEIHQMRESYELKTLEMQKRLDLLSGLLTDLQQESRDLKRKNEEYLAELSGLRAALRGHQ